MRHSYLWALIIPAGMAMLPVLGCQNKRWPEGPEYSGRVLHVPDDYPSIQNGIDAAVRGDTVLVYPGTYNEWGITLKSGICLKSRTGAPYSVTIDAQWQGRLLYMDGVDSTTVIQGFTFTQGIALGMMGGRYGGGAFCKNSSPRFKACVFSENTGQNGGGVYCLNSDPTFTICTFSRNTAQNGGGIFLSSSSAVLSNCTFSENAGTSGKGSAIYGEEGSFVRVENSIVASGFGGTPLDGRPVAGAALSCCNVYGNGAGNYVALVAGQDTLDGNFSADPLFCRPPADYRVAISSPCLDRPGCGLVGAWGHGCMDSSRVFLSHVESAGGSAWSRSAGTP